MSWDGEGREKCEVGDKLANPPRNRSTTRDIDLRHSRTLKAIDTPFAKIAQEINDAFRLILAFTHGYHIRNPASPVVVAL
jgi:hypothetical protein